MKTLAVIPARYGSVRLPGKPLLDICGKPMIQHVYELVSRVQGLDAVVVATDDAHIAEVVQAFGGKAFMTSPDCRSGSDRVREVAESLPADIYINVQGDEPLLEPTAIEKLLAVFIDDAQVQVATLCSRISERQARSPHQVKVVCDNTGDALYFSRSLIPFVRDDASAPALFWGHIGIYAYKAAALHLFRQLPSTLEQLEKLEQLRFLQAGIPIRVLEVTTMGAGVDTVDDLERVRAVFKERSRAAVLKKLENICLVITDVDGVLTDGGLYYGVDGESLKRFHSRDGLGIKLLQEAGIQVAVLSGRDCPALRKRLEDLGITIFRLGQRTKGAACRSIIAEAHVTREETLFLGDDIPDLEAFSYCGVNAAVGDAAKEVRQAAELILKTGGGHGAFRELADTIRLVSQEDQTVTLWGDGHEG